MNNKTAKLVVVRAPQGITTFDSGKLLALVNSYKCETDSAEFRQAWDAICTEKFRRHCELIGITYAD